jgi:hypothetical protein
VYVVGGRAFTSQVMQKNCTEFIAYENVAGKGGATRVDRGRPAGFASQSLDQALPLVKRALKVLTDREVSPQLGLLKSTLLQLDSSFSERDYGAGTFRDFAEKLEKRGLVSLKHSGRTTLVELAEGVSLDAPADTFAPAVSLPRAEGVQSIDGEQPHERPRPESQEPVTELTLADGVALVRQVLAEATVPPRWPMYLRQMKQFLRNARPDFDERRYGSLQDLLRACQKAGLVRLERDRQGGLRAFAGAVKPYVPAGWVAPDTETAADVQEASSAAVDAMVVTEGDVTATSSVSAESETSEVNADMSTFDEQGEAAAPFAGSDAGPASFGAHDDTGGDEPRDDETEADDQLAMFGVVRPTDPEPVKAKRAPARRTRKTTTTDTPRRTRKTPARRSGGGTGTGRGRNKG